MPHLGSTELIIILIIVLAIFGAGKLSSLGGALGRGVKDFRAAMGDNEKRNSGGGGSSEPKATSQEGSDQGA